MTRILGVMLVAGSILAPAVYGQQRAPAQGSASVTSPMNLNTASVIQLESLPGIGRSTAERIVEYRQKNGGFKKVEELMNVRGVGEKSFLKLKALITVLPQKAERAAQ